MHSSVLQNKKYIAFSSENTVEVISLGRLDEGIQKGDARAATYEAEDEEGNKVQRLVSWPSLTVEEIDALRRSKAGTYNDTGKIPFTCVVNPHTLEEMQRWSGGQSSKTIIEAVTEHKKTLAKEHGPSLSRSVLAKFRQQATVVRETLAKYGVAKAMTKFRTLERFAGKYGETMQGKAAELGEELMDAARADLDKAESLIEAGDTMGAKKILTPLRSALRVTDLAALVKELMEKASA
jgi:hypothetical protein